MADYYDILAVSRSADDKEIRQAYRRLARQHHPDVNPGDESRGGTVQERSMLPTRCCRTPTSGPSTTAMATAGSRPSISSSNAAPDPPNSSEEAISVEAAVGSTSAPVARPCPTCWEAWAGSPLKWGATSVRGSGRGPRMCAWKSRWTRPTVAPTRLVSLPDGRRLEVKIPAGHRRRRAGAHRGRQQRRRRVQPAGDGDCPTVVSSARATTCTPGLTCRCWTRSWAGSATVTTLRGQIELTLPPETQNGRRFRLAGQGMARLNDPETAGQPVRRGERGHCPPGSPTSSDGLFRTDPRRRGRGADAQLARSNDHDAGRRLRPPSRVS